MTDLRQPVRAVARVTAQAAPAGPAFLEPKRRPDRLGPIHLLQLLLVQATVVMVGFALTRGLLVVVAAVVGSGLLLVALGRWEHRWLLEHVAIGRQFQRRRRARPGPAAADPRLAALRVLAPTLTVEDVPVADGSQVGVARDDAGWFAAMTVDQDQDPALASGGLRLDRLVQVLAEVGQPGAVLQVVRHTVPAPSAEVHPRSPASRSYRQLLASLGAAPVPLDRATWIAVRLDARALARSGAAAAELAKAPTVVAGLIRSVGKAARRQAVPGQVLDAAGLLDALARACDLAAPAAPGPREEWTRWHSARLAHRTFWVRRWPPVEHAAGLLEWFAAAPAAASNVTLVLAPAGEAERVDLRALVRLSAPAAALGGLCQAVTDGALRVGARMFPLDGEQGPAVYATAPTGGGPQ